MPYDLSTPVKAFKAAMEMIDAYQFDIRNSEVVTPIDLLEYGFCQGSYYRNLSEKLGQVLRELENQNGGPINYGV